MAIDGNCEDTVSTSQTLTCSSSINTSECDGIEVETDGTSNDRNCSSHCSISDESANTRKSLINVHTGDESNEHINTSKISIFSKCLFLFNQFADRKKIC